MTQNTHNTPADTDTPVTHDLDYDVATLRGLTSFDDAVSLLTETYGEIENATEVIGSGFTLTDTNGKYKLIDEPFLIVRMAFPASATIRDSETGEFRHYAVVHIMTRDGRKLIITDGGVGIYQQCEEWSIRTGKRGGLYVPGGLRASEYDLPDGSGKGMTYYLNV